MTSRVVEGALDPTDLLLGTEDPASGALVVVTASRDGGDPAPADGGAGSGTAGAVDEGEAGSAPATPGARDVDAALDELEDEAVDRFDVRRCRLRVRPGAPAGEPTVLAVVRARHRRAAFGAARWAVSSALGRLSEAVPPAPSADGRADDPGRGGP